MSVHSRRSILKVAGQTALALLVGKPAFAARTTSAPRALSLYSIHTGERMRVEYFDHGRYQVDGLRAISRLLRDHRTDEVHPIDPTLLDAVHRLCLVLGTRAPLHVVSGYRCEATNAWLRETGHNVAEHSFHLRGQAVDFFLPGRSLRDVRRVALRLAAGGVGYYPGSGFVHVDTGPVRTWATWRG